MSAPAGEQPPVTEPDAPAEAPDARPTQPPAPEADDAVKDQESDLPEWVKEKIRKANNEAKNLRSRLKEQEPIVAAAQEAEEAKKSELQRANERIASMEQELSTAQLSAERMGLAAKFAIPESHHRFIVGATPEEREESAALIATSLLNRDEPARPPSQRPVESLRPGATPERQQAPDNSYRPDFMPNMKRHNQF